MFIEIDAKLGAMEGLSATKPQILILEDVVHMKEA